MDTATAQPRTTGSRTPSEAFDDVLVQPVEHEDRPSAPAGPADGWQHAPLVRWLATQPRERRETVLAVGFAALAVLWAPLGIIALLAGWAAPFLLLSLVALVLLVAPRPTLPGDRTGSLRDTFAVLGEHAATVAADVRRRTAPQRAAARQRLAALAASARTQARRGMTAARERGAAFAQDADLQARTDAARRALRARALRTSAAVRTWWRGLDHRDDPQVGTGRTARGPELSDPLSRWLDGQSTPSSTR